MERDRGIVAIIISFSLVLDIQGKLVQLASPCCALDLAEL